MHCSHTGSTPSVGQHIYSATAWPRHWVVHKENPCESPGSWFCRCAIEGRTGVCTRSAVASPCISATRKWGPRLVCAHTKRRPARHIQQSRVAKHANDCHVHNGPGDSGSPGNTYVIQRVGSTGEQIAPHAPGAGKGMNLYSCHPSKTGHDTAA